MQSNSYPHQHLFDRNVIDLGLPEPAYPTRSSNPRPLAESSISMSRQRRKERACDACRRRKTKCDGPWMQNNVCTNCLQTRKQCTYLEMSKPRGPPKAYVNGLEDKVEYLEAMLNQLHPGADFSDEIGPSIPRDSWKGKSFTDSSKQPPLRQSSSLQTLNASTSFISLEKPYRITKSSSPPSLPTSPLNRTTHLQFKHPLRRRSEPRISSAYRGGNNGSDDYSSGDSTSSTSDVEEIVESFIGGRKKLNLSVSEIDGSPSEGSAIRFHGKSSTAGLVEATRRFKQMHLKDTVEAEPSMVSDGRQEGSAPPDNSAINKSRRPEFWQMHTWEKVYEGCHDDSPSLIPPILPAFPPQDLAEELVNLYFAHTNNVFPLLHRPTFERQWREKLHHKNIWFTCVCLGIFAIASRWSNDRRMLPDHEQLKNKEFDWSSAGRRYFERAIDIHRARQSLLYSATLFEVQSFCLLGNFLRGTRDFPFAWTFVSAGLRKAMDVGAHRKRIYRGGPNPDDELWKRAFWHLVVFDRLDGAILGRGCGISEEDFDVEFLLEVDDEYWEHEDPALKFKQPPGKPSIVAAFNQFIKLTQIMAFAMRTVYAVDKTKLLGGLINEEWDNRVIKLLNTAMSEWINGVPEHIRWSDQMDNSLFSNQATTLYSLYYLVQMLIYRPFITIPKISNPHPNIEESPYPALVICTKAARLCARVIEVQIARGMTDIPSLINVAYISAAHLLLAVWDLKAQRVIQQQSGLKDMKPRLGHQINDLLVDVRIFIDALKWIRPHWEVVDLYLTMLDEIMPYSNDDIQELRQVVERRLLPVRPSEMRSSEQQNCDSSLSTPSQLRASNPPIAIPSAPSQFWDSVQAPQVMAATASPRLYPTIGPSPTRFHRTQPSSPSTQQDSALLKERYNSHLHAFPDNREDMFAEEAKTKSRNPRNPYPPSTHHYTHSSDIRLQLPPDLYAHRSVSPRIRTFSDDTVPAIQYYASNAQPTYNPTRRTSFPNLSNIHEEAVDRRRNSAYHPLHKSISKADLTSYQANVDQRVGHRGQHPYRSHEAAYQERKSVAERLPLPYDETVYRSENVEAHVSSVYPEQRGSRSYPTNVQNAISSVRRQEHTYGFSADAYLYRQ